MFGCQGLTRIYQDASVLDIIMRIQLEGIERDRTRFKVPAPLFSYIVLGLQKSFGLQSVLQLEQTVSASIHPADLFLISA